MKEPAARPFASCQEFELFEELSEAARGWELDFCQLSRPEAKFYLEQVAGPSVQVSRAFFPSSFHQLGGSTPGCRTVSILAPGPAPVGWRWCGETITRNSLLVMPPGGEFESFSTPNFESIHLALPLTLLERVAECQFGVSLQRVMPGGRIYCPNGGESLGRLRRLLLSVTRGPGAWSREPRCEFDATLESQMAALVLECLQQNLALSPRDARSPRMLALARALNVIGDTEDYVVDMSGLASAVGVSRRTLENAFRDGLGVSPAFFIRARKLRRFNRALLHADANREQVADIARKQGYRHLGKLAGDYRTMFGELPSTTMRRRIALQS